MDLKEKQKLYVLFGIFGIAAILFNYSILLKPQFLRFIAYNRDFYAIKKRVGNAEALIANEDNIKRQYGILEKQSEFLERRFPGQEEIPNLLGDFSDVAESSGVKILKIKPLEVVEDISKSGSGGGFYYELPILIEANAGYHQAAIFINNIENMDRFIKITDIDIRSRPSDPRHHDIKMKISTYVAQ